ncbi:MAG: hypothetical protein JXR91_04100 [Deltaproteobacteria bacterium]|nr:hypothetical protein [Deltaproteobacteria bacterium]
MPDFNIDYDNLFTSKESEKWEDMISHIVSETSLRHKNRTGFITQLYKSTFPILAAATLITGIVWGVAYSKNQTISNYKLSDNLSTEEEIAAIQLVSFAKESDLPTTEQMWSLLGGFNEAK